MRDELAKHADKLTEDEKTAIEAALKEVEDAAKGEDVETITAATTKIFEAAGPLYKAMSESMAPPEGAPAAEEAKKDDDVVDATFTEVKDGKKDKAA
jgi:molecular chaperone DnaK